MLSMTTAYARSRDAKALRTRDWLVANMGVKPFSTPHIQTFDVDPASGKAITGHHDDNLVWRKDKSSAPAPE